MTARMITARRPTLIEATLAKLAYEPTDDCIEWTGTRDVAGYGNAWDSRSQRQAKAHRLIYELAVAPVPPDLHVDHLCRNRACVNPRHLEPVTELENVQRSHAAVYNYDPKVTCRNGHARRPENRMSTGQCKPCHAEQMRRYRAEGRTS